MGRSKALLLFVALALTACGGAGKVPAGDWEIWVGSPEKQGIERRQAGQVIRADDPAFGDFLAFRRENFTRNINRLIGSCERWRPGTKFMSKAQLQALAEEAGY